VGWGDGDSYRGNVVANVTVSTSYVSDFEATNSATSCNATNEQRLVDGKDIVHLLTVVRGQSDGKRCSSS
jgi:hypothetical protein